MGIQSASEESSATGKVETQEKKLGSSRKDNAMRGYTKERLVAVIGEMTGPNQRSIAEEVDEEQICAATL